MKLNEIRNHPGARRRKFKLGRGSSSGLGKTSGRGVKGAKARTGTKVYGFEGGQMPLHMRTPKRGFNNIFAYDFSEVNIGALQKALDDKRLKNEGRLTEDGLRKAGLARYSRHGVRLLGKGRLSAKIDIEVAGVSAGARAAVEKAGGSVSVTFKKRVYSNRKGEAGKRQKRRAAAAAKKAGKQGAK